MNRYIMALDAGTTSTRCMLFDKKGQIVTMAQQEFPQYFPTPGWVEHDANEIFDSILLVAQKALKHSGITAEQIVSIGITNQRETTVVWNKTSGVPLCPAIVWQCRRTAEICEKLKDDGYTEMFRQKTGLTIDAYFSATKLVWILEHIPNAREKAEQGELLFGTIETWLIWKLTGGRVHVTDYSNASRTMLFNIHDLCWDEDILKTLSIPRKMLPTVKSSSEHYGTCDLSYFHVPIPITGAAGDQQAALFGQGCFKPGTIKNTYGTGGFLLMNTGSTQAISKNGLLTTIAWGINGQITYALEGSVFTAGAVIQWLRDELGLIASAAESESAACQVLDTNGCYLVPAFTGLGAPHWNAYARGTIVGLTRGTNRCHIVRAALEAIAYQVNDVLSIMEQESSHHIDCVRVDGGASANNLLMQMQADISAKTIVRPACVETTAMGAAFLAGLAVGFWNDCDEITAILATDRIFSCNISEQERSMKLTNWSKAVASCLNLCG